MMVGTPAAETREEKATGDARMVQRRREATASISAMALRGSPEGVTFEIHLLKGKTPSRATAQMRREAATPAMEVLKMVLRTTTTTMGMWPR